MKRPAGFLSDPPLDEEATAVHEADLADDGYVANFTRLWCWRPDLLEAFAKLRADLLAGSTLSPREVAVMVAATAAARGDSYCSLAWGKKLADLTDEATAADVLTGLTPKLSAREAVLLAWSRQVVHDPNATTTADIDQLRQAGLSEREIFEATTWIGLRLAFSTINDALGARPDAELVEKAPELVREAVRVRPPRLDRGFTASAAPLVLHLRFVAPRPCGLSCSSRNGGNSPPLGDRDADEDRHRPDRQRQREPLAEDHGREDQPGDRLQELERCDPRDAAAREGPVPPDIAHDRGHRREEDDGAPRAGRVRADAVVGEDGDPGHDEHDRGADEPVERRREARIAGAREPCAGHVSGCHGE